MTLVQKLQTVVFVVVVLLHKINKGLLSGRAKNLRH
jgi:hypothetical protein